MNLDRETIREFCTDAVFDRGRNYRQEGRIQQLRQFESTITAAVRGSNVYDVTVDPNGPDIEARCTCPYDGPGECKHVVAVLLEVTADPPSDESDPVDEVLAGLTEESLREFVRDELAENPAMRDRLLARFGDEQPTVEEYRAESRSSVRSIHSSMGSDFGTTRTTRPEGQPFSISGRSIPARF